MKVVKLTTFLLVCVFLAIVVVQNQGVFMDKKALELNLVVWSYKTEPIHLSLYFLGFFLIGLLVSYVYGLGQRFKTKKIIASQKETIRRSQDEIESLKNQPLAEQETSSAGNTTAAT